MNVYGNWYRRSTTATPIIFKYGESLLSYIVIQLRLRYMQPCYMNSCSYILFFSSPLRSRQFKFGFFTVHPNITPA